MNNETIRVIIGMLIDLIPIAATIIITILIIKAVRRHFEIERYKAETERIKAETIKQEAKNEEREDKIP